MAKQIVKDEIEVNTNIKRKQLQLKHDVDYYTSCDNPINLYNNIEQSATEK